MLRRLMLTGGLILLGESSNTQIFLGALICTGWLCLVLARRPYEASWDNTLSVVSSSGLLLIILSGMALEIYRLTPEYAQDLYEKNAFRIVMMSASGLVILFAAATIIISIPCLRDSLSTKRSTFCLRHYRGAVVNRKPDRGSRHEWSKLDQTGQRGSRGSMQFDRQIS